MSEYNRHAKYHRNRVPRKKRALQIYGEGGDTGKWYKCWYCGFINNIDRNQVADEFTAENGSQSLVLEYDGFSPNTFGMEDARYTVLTIDNAQSVSLMELDGAGDIKPIYAPRYPNVTRGCSFCGSTNYR